MSERSASPPAAGAHGAWAPAASTASAASTARKRGLAVCPSCELLCRQVRLPGHAHAHYDCPRCGAQIHLRKPESLARTWALILSAYIFYIPANLLPMTYSTKLGQTQVDTIMSGVIYFIVTGAPHLALIIFVASICVPLIKLVLLTALLISIHRRSRWRPRERTRFYRLVETIGRWSMVDLGFGGDRSRGLLLLCGGDSHHAGLNDLRPPSHLGRHGGHQ
ncbi:MAG: paraquat-inducible protein A [Desulfosarcinaceae bacterium]